KDSVGALSGLRVMTLISPPTASEPYNVEAGPLTISTRSISDVGIPVSPYTDANPLTMGIPSMRIMVYGPSSPLIWMSPVLHTLQLICGRTPLTFCRASKTEGVGLQVKYLEE